MAVDLHRAVRDVLAELKQRRPRYMAMGFSSRREASLHEIRAQLVTIAPDLDVWDVPGIEGTPRAPLLRREFCNRMFGTPRSVPLLVFHPEFWMTDWEPSDARVFWSGLSEYFGGRELFVLFGDTPGNRRDAGDYFSDHRLADTDVRVWMSKREMN